MRPQVCRTGQKLDANAAGILRIFDVRMAECKLKLLAVWRSSGGGGEGEGEDGTGGDGEVEVLSEDDGEYGEEGPESFEPLGDDCMGSGGFSDEPEGGDGDD